MVAPTDMNKHRQSLSEQLALLSKEVEGTSAGGHVLAEFGRRLHAFTEYLDEQQTLHRAEELLFQRLILATARMSTDFDEFKSKCLQLEIKLGFVQARSAE